MCEHLRILNLQVATLITIIVQDCGSERKRDDMRSERRRRGQGGMHKKVESKGSVPHIRKVSPMIMINLIIINAGVIPCVQARCRHHHLTSSF